MNRIPLLLADPSPCLRALVLSELLGRAKGDQELLELSALRETDPVAMRVLSTQQEDGSWKTSLPASRGTALQATARALTCLGYLGFTDQHPAVHRGAEYIFAAQLKDGAWALTVDDSEAEESSGYSMIPLQTAFPLRGLAACGYATDPRAEKAYDWLVSKRLPDGAWSTGKASGSMRRVGGYRRLAHSQWGCRSNTTAALICLSLHPQRCHSAEARRGLDLLLGRETREQYALGFEVARIIGVEPARGFLTYFARFDLALVLDLCWRVGASKEDERIAALVSFIENAQGQYGLWEYTSNPQVSRWLSFDLLRSLSRIDTASDWLSMEPRTPFRAYAQKRKRY